MTDEMVRPSHPMTVMTRGAVPDESVAYATKRLGSLMGHIAEPVLLARVKLTEAPHGEWRHGDPPTERPEYFDRPPDERELVRHKSYPIDWLTSDEAAFDMEQRDFDFYLFRDRVSGDDALLERRSDGSYRLTRLRTTATAEPASTLTVEHAEHAAPTLELDEAIERIGVGGERFVFFANSTTGRANVLYRRYDGHYGLIAPD